MLSANSISVQFLINQIDRGRSGTSVDRSEWGTAFTAELARTMAKVRTCWRGQYSRWQHCIRWSPLAGECYGRQLGFIILVLQISIPVGAWHWPIEFSL